MPVSLLFVCVHNAGRSQMAAAFASALGRGSVEVRSAGSAPVATVNAVVAEAMREVGIEVAATPQRLADAHVLASDVVITMGCGDACPVYPGKRYEDWAVDDPAGQGIEVVRRIRDDVQRRVAALLADLGVAAEIPGAG